MDGVTPQGQGEGGGAKEKETEREDGERVLCLDVLCCAHAHERTSVHIPPHRPADPPPKETSKMMEMNAAADADHTTDNNGELPPPIHTAIDLSLHNHVSPEAVGMETKSHTYHTRPCVLCVCIRALGLSLRDGLLLVSLRACVNDD